MPLQDERAIEYWRKAGELAIGRGAFHEAVAQLASALRILAKLPEGRPRDQTELALHASLANALLAARGFAAFETGAAYARVRRLSERLGDRTQLLLACSAAGPFISRVRRFRMPWPSPMRSHGSPGSRAMWPPH